MTVPNSKKGLVDDMVESDGAQGQELQFFSLQN